MKDLNQLKNEVKRLQDVIVDAYALVFSATASPTHQQYVEDVRKVEAFLRQHAKEPGKAGYIRVPIDCALMAMEALHAQAGDIAGHSQGSDLIETEEHKWALEIEALLKDAGVDAGVDVRS